MAASMIYVLLCAVSVARPDCQKETAIDVILGPEVQNEIQCGITAQEYVAKASGLTPRDGQYYKIACTPNPNALKSFVLERAKEKACQSAQVTSVDCSKMGEKDGG